MGPIADRTIENLGVGDTAIAKIRRLLLQTLRDVAAGKEPPGLDPASYRVRSAAFLVAPGQPFQAALDAAVKIRAPAEAK
jgi:hypothetical protein